MRARASYAGLAIGDALGATVEFMTPREIRHRYGLHSDIIGGGWLHLGKGEVTDDTEMSLALGRSIIQQNRVDALAIAEAFSDWMRGKPRDIGNTVRRGIMRFRKTGEPETPPSEMDAGNGSCMRCLPVALCTLGDNKDSIASASRCQAHVTHNSRLTDNGTECVIDVLQLALTQADKKTIAECFDDLIAVNPEFRLKVSISNPSGYIVDTLQVVFDAFLSTPSFEACLVDVVNRGGDADTTGAIAGMIAGAFYGMDQIPQIWLKAMNRSIMDECMEQAESLIEISPLMKGANKVVGNRPGY